MSQATVGSDPQRVAEPVPKPPKRRWAGALANVVTGALLLAIGLVGGFVAASQKAPVDDHEHAHGGGDDHGHGHGDEHDHGHAHAPKLTKQTLANLGVEVGEVQPGEFVRTRDVPAVVAERPGSLRPASAPVAGVVEEVLVLEGQRVEAGAPVAQVRRDPFPRPSLVLTDAVLRPLNEEFHDAVAALRSSSQALAIAQEELARVRRALSGASDALPSKVEVDARNEERRATRALANAREEAERHGLTAADVAAIESGQTTDVELPPAQRVLAHNGLWSEDASRLLAALPEDVRARRYAVAVVAELVGSRALTPRMAELVQTRPAIAAAFLDLAGLIQHGWSAESVIGLADAGALEPVVTVRAPKGAKDWDVESVRVRAGERVEAGTTLAECRDGSTLVLELAPAGPDLPAIATALTSRETVTAEPLVPGAGPSLDGLRLHRLESGGAHAGSGSAEVLVANRVLTVTETEDRAFRSWAVRPGLRYVVRVPLERLRDRFVLPASALATRGPDTVLLLEDGDGFRPVAVRVEHRDARTAVVAKDGAVFPGDRVVLKGAFSVLLAIQSAASGVDPHAGHDHSH